MDQKIDILIALAQGQNRSILNLSNEMGSVVGDIQRLSDNSKVKYELQEATGKIARLEKAEERLNQKISFIEQREYRKSLVIYNVEEHGRQSNQLLADIVYDFIANTLEIDPEYIFSRTTPSAEIRIDTILRLGKPKTDSDKPRPILVQFLTGMGKDMVYNQDTLAKLRSSESTIRMAEQFTPEIREKRTAQRPLFIEYKNHYKNTPTKVNLVQDKIVINKKTHTLYQLSLH